MSNWGELVRRSIRKDFAKAHFKRNREVKTPHPKDTRRVLEVGEKSSYLRFRRLIVGRLVRLVEQGSTGYWVEFVNEVDRNRLNTAAGWSQNKTRYLFDNVKFD